MFEHHFINYCRNRKMRTLFTILAIGSALLGCASVTDVVSTGPETYMVAAEGVLGNSSSGKQAFKAQEQAAAFCNAKGMQVETISSQEVPGGFAKVASATVNFKCLKK